MTCECHDTEAEHERWSAEQMAYWRAYFGDSIQDAVESERFYKENGEPV